jgi:hypothetical protein
LDQGADLPAQKCASKQGATAHTTGNRHMTLRGYSSCLLRGQVHSVWRVRKFQTNAPENCLLRIETLRAEAEDEKREEEEKTTLKIRVKQVENL